MERAICYINDEGLRVISVLNNEKADTYDFNSLELPDRWWPKLVADAAINDDFCRAWTDYDPACWRHATGWWNQPANEFYAAMKQYTILADVMNPTFREMDYSWCLVTQDLTGGHDEDSNGGHYRWYAQLGISDGRFFYRNIASFHGDLEDIPMFQEISKDEFAQRMADAVDAERQLYSKKENPWAEQTNIENKKDIDTQRRRQRRKSRNSDIER